jgi:hypothetical protein
MGEEGAAIVDAGGVFVEVVEQGSSPGPSTQADLDGWVATHDLEISTVKPRNGETAQLEGREWSYIINLETMTIEFKQKAGINGALDEMMERLGSP